MKSRLGLALVVAALLGWTTLAMGVPPTVSTWTGGGVAGNWADPANWNNGVPSGEQYQAVIPNGTGALSFTSGIPAILNQLTTGDGAISLNTGMTFNADSFNGYSPVGGFTVGSGGLSFNGAVGFTNGSSFITANGDLTAASFGWGNTGTITQNAGLFYVASFSVPAPATNILAWHFGAGSPSNIGNGGYPAGTHQFTGTPVFQPGWRPDWYMSSGYYPPAIQWDLNGQTVFGNRLYVQGLSAPTRAAYLYNNVAGGILDLNEVHIGYGYDTNTYANSYVDLSNTAATVRGNGTVAIPAWDNRSTNNTLFKIANSTTVTFSATSGTQYVHTGSTDGGGFTNNFAFGNVVIGANNTVQLTGTANIGSGNDALYVNGRLQGGDGSILNLNGHKAYVNGGLTPGLSVGNMTITATGGAFALTSNTEALTFELGPTDAFGVGLAGQNDHVQINGGTFTLDGILNMVDLGGENYSAGRLLYHLFDYTGTLVNNGLELGSGFPGPAFLEITSSQINLIITPEPAMAMLGLVGAGLVVVRRRRVA